MESHPCTKPQGEGIPRFCILLPSIQCSRRNGSHANLLESRAYFTVSITLPGEGCNFVLATRHSPLATSFSSAGSQKSGSMPTGPLHPSPHGVRIDTARKQFHDPRCLSL
jgi:hypothetical protein